MIIINFWVPKILVAKICVCKSPLHPLPSRRPKSPDPIYRGDSFDAPPVSLPLGEGPIDPLRQILGASLSRLDLDDGIRPRLRRQDRAADELVARDPRGDADGKSVAEKKENIGGGGAAPGERRPPPPPQ